MALVLHARNTSHNAYKTLIVAEYNGVKIEVAKDFKIGESNKTPEFLKMNPIGKVPVLETPDGPIFESSAIVRYVARLKADTTLFGSSPIDNARVEQWIDFASFEIFAWLESWLSLRFGKTMHLPPVEELAIAQLKRALEALNTHLASNTYLVGHTVTLADIVLTSNLYLGFSQILTKPFTKEFPHVERYFWTIVNEPNFKKVLGEVKQADVVPDIEKKHKLKDEPKKERPKPTEEAPKTKPKITPF